MADKFDVVNDYDIVKSTTDHVFTAYGDKIIVWDAKSGHQQSTTKIELINEKLAEPKSSFSFQRKKLLPKIENLYLHGSILIAIVSQQISSFDPMNLNRDIVHDFKNTAFLMSHDISSIPTDGSILPLF